MAEKPKTEKKILVATNEDLPFVGKYRPKNLEEFIGNEKEIVVIRGMLKFKKFPNILIHGPAGTGKTSLANIIADELKAPMLEVDASQELNMEYIKTDIKNFAKQGAISGKFKIVFLDEADKMRFDLQQALRRTMEKYSKNCKFILACNYPENIILPLHSRCLELELGPIKKSEIHKRLTQIAEAEKMVLDDKTIGQIVEITEGDMRKATNLLNKLYYVMKMKGKAVSLSMVANFGKIKGVEELCTLAINNKFKEAREKLMDVYKLGVSEKSIISQMFEYFQRQNLQNKNMAKIFALLAKFEVALHGSVMPIIQLSGLVAEICLLGDK
jgi:replication factor C small subunit